MSKIIVIEDEIALQMLLEYDFKESGFDLVFFSDGQEGLNALQNNHYDLAIIDWMLPSLSGVEIIKEIRKSKTDLKIIMLTALDNEMDIVKGLEAGADDYLTKPFSSRELKARVNALLRRLKRTNLVINNNIEVNVNKREVKLNNEVVNLSKIEYDILLYLYDNLNIVLNRQDIIDKLWIDDDIDERVIDTHISIIKKKLDLKDKIITKRGVGYVFIE